MIPSIEHFSKRYLRVAVYPMYMIPAILTFSLTRNAINISLMEMIFGLGAIAGSIAWGIMQDGRGYWFYTITSLRVYEAPEKLREMMHLVPDRRFSPCYYLPPLAVALTFSYVIALCMVGWLLVPAYFYSWTWLCGLIFIPMWLVRMHRTAVKYQIKRALRHLGDEERLAIRPRTLYSSLLEDLVVSLLINFALVFPLAHKPQFSLTQGSHDPAFMVAFVILLWIVTGFMLLFAARPRRYILCGEMVCGDVDDSFVKHAPSAFLRKVGLGWRVLLWGVFIPFWGGGVCILCSGFTSKPSFVPLYLFGLLGPVAIYCVERYWVLYKNYYQAKEVFEQMAIAKSRLKMKVF